MSITQVKENVVTLLENIVKRSEIMEKQSGSRMLLEIDLAMEDVRLLYREMERLRKFAEAEGLSGALNIRNDVFTQPKAPPQEPAPVQQKETAPEQPVAPKPVEREVVQTRQQAPPAPEPQKPEPQVQPPAPVREEPVAKEPVKQQEATPEPVQQQQAEPQKPVIKTPEPQLKSEPAPVPEEPKTPVVQPRPQNNKPPKVVAEAVDQKKTVVGETFSREKSSVHERLAMIKDDKSIGARMQYKPVASIKEAIGINDKFLFVNELFNGDLNVYNEAVEKLNSCPSIHEAFEMLNGLTVTFHWDGERSAETIDKFANIVQRRYM